ncbi:MAG: response regulator transcription factor [Lachnospiraceae bacterium]|nr:response regulator transcription factor [Lachnospiraceae bacterium]
MENVKILVVDDEHEIVDAICKLLQTEGYETFKAYDGLEALDVLNQEEIHLIIMDIMMPKQDGLSTMMQVRMDKNIPIILLTAKTEESDLVLGLSMGADDYISKPYKPAELLARVKSQTRRYLKLGNYGVPKKNPREIIVNGGLELNVKEKQLYVDGEPVKLTAKEYNILMMLMKNPGMVFSAETIYEKVWNDIAYGVENTVMVHIRRLREKIEINPSEPKYIKVVWGIGYKMDKI